MTQLKRSLSPMLEEVAEEGKQNNSDTKLTKNYQQLLTQKLLTSIVLTEGLCLGFSNVQLTDRAVNDKTFSILVVLCVHIRYPKQVKKQLLLFHVVSNPSLMLCCYSLFTSRRAEKSRTFFMQPLVEKTHNRFEFLIRLNSIYKFR